MKKIVITGASTYGVKNAGDDAMLKNLVDGLRRKIPDCRITFVTRHPDKKFDTLFHFRSIKNIDHDNKKGSLGRWFFGFNPGDSTEHLARIRLAIGESDLIVIGGNSFMEVSRSDFLRGVPSYSALFGTWARLFEKPYALYGVAAHPLKDDYTKQIARFLCDNAAVVTVREEFTKERLLAAGANGKNIHALADPAFGIDPVRDREKALRILHRENIRITSRNIIGIAFRHMYWKWNKDETAVYCKKMASLCDFAVEYCNAELLFIPNCTYHIDTPFEDDRVILGLILQRMRHKKKAHRITGELDLQETLSLFQLLQLHISNRRHSCIFAALHNCPIISMSTGHAWHFSPFMRALSIPDQAVNFVGDSIDSLKRKIKETWDHPEAVVDRIKRRIPELRKKAHRHVDLLVKAMK